MTEKDVAKIRNEVIESGPSSEDFMKLVTAQNYIPVKYAAPWMTSGTWNENNYCITIVHLETKELIVRSGQTLHAARKACLDAIELNSAEQAK